MANIFALRRRKHELATSMKAVLASAEGRELTAAEDQNLSKVQAALKDVETQIIAEERNLAEEANLPLTADENSAFAAMARGESPAEQPNRAKKPRGFIGAKSFADLWGPPRGDGGFKSFEEYLRSVKLAQQHFDPRLRMSMIEDNASQSGWLVPETWSAQVLNYALESSLVMPRARVFPMSSEVLKVPGTQDTDHSSGSLYGNIQEFWSDELQDIQEQNMKTRLVQLTAEKLAMLANASSELTEDSPSFETLLTANLQAAASFFLDKNFLTGSGVGRPLGMFNAGNPSLLVVNKNGSTPAHGFLWEDAVAMYTAMAPACRGRATWIASNDLLPVMSVMQLTVKNVAGTDNVGGSATPMFTLNDDGTGTLLGRPVLFTEKMATAGTQGDIGFACLDQYAVGIRRDMQLRRSIDAGFVNDSIWWRLTTRVDGQPLWEKKLTLSNSQVVSAFVVLQARP